MVLYDILAFLNQISRKVNFGLQIGTDVDTSKYLILNYGIEDKVDSDEKKEVVFPKINASGTSLAEELTSP